MIYSTNSIKHLFRVMGVHGGMTEVEADSPDDAMINHLVLEEGFTREDAIQAVAIAENEGEYFGGQFDVQRIEKPGVEENDGHYAW